MPFVLKSENIMSSYLNQFLVNVRGLKQGSYTNTFEIGEEFFNCFEFSLIKNGNLHVDLRIEKISNLAHLYFDIKGAISFPCDTCLADLPFEVNSTHKILVKQMENSQASDYEDDDIAVLHEDQNELNIANYLYELISISKPMRSSCEGLEPKPCDQDFKQILQQLKPQEQPQTIAETQAGTWDKLKQIKF